MSRSFGVDVFEGRMGVAGRRYGSESYVCFLFCVCFSETVGLSPPV